MPSDLLVTCRVPDISLGEAHLVLEEGLRWGLPGHLNGTNLVFRLPDGELPTARRVLDLLDGALDGRNAQLQLHAPGGPPLFAGSYQAFAEGVLA